ncbi:MAG: 16S rRNA (cytosine(1402)-N(4))-methyltransferase RsmH [Acidimicrobiales bacterium]|jgi:16S rRNA (cytosine1402-N4)-methyltransferase
MVHHGEHRPVLLDEVLELFAPLETGVVIDATLGDGGHAAALLVAHPEIRVVGIDRDSSAIESAQRTLAPFRDRVVFVQGRFSKIADGRITEFVGPDSAAAPGKSIELGELQVSGVLFDLGVRSAQIEQGERGFSYRNDGPIDMRMDRDTGVPASVLVNEESESYLAQIFAESGEGRFARRIARAIVRARPLASTGELAAVVDRAIPASARRRGPPAARVFQALRIAVNSEIDELRVALPTALDTLSVGGRCAVISYHSGEDRVVKSTFVEASTGGCRCPVGLPCVCGARAEYKLVFRGSKKATLDESVVNPRSKSARLRAIERTPAPTDPDGSTPPRGFVS